MAQLGEYGRERLTLRELQAHAPVARQVSGAGEDQISSAGESHESLGPPAEGDAQARDFRETARDEGRARVVAVTQAIADAGGDRHNVFCRARDFDADQVVTRIHAKRRAVQQPRGFPRKFTARRSQRHGSGQPARHFLGKARSGQATCVDRLAEYFGAHLMRELRLTRLEPFAQPYDRRARIRRFNAQQCLAQCSGGDRYQREPGAVERDLDGGLNFELGWERVPWKILLVGASGAHLRTLTGITRPQRDAVVPRETQRDCSTPGPGAQDCDFHCLEGKEVTEGKHCLGEGRLRRETVEGFPLLVERRGPSLKASGAP